MPSFMWHPNDCDPSPSAHDLEVADKYQVKILTLHRSGLYEYDPGSRETTKLRSGMRWLLRAAAQEVAATPDGPCHHAKHARGSKRLQWASRASQLLITEL